MGICIWSQMGETSNIPFSILFSPKLTLSRQFLHPSSRAILALFVLACTSLSSGQGDDAQAELHFTWGEMHHTTVSQVMELPVFI